jgi:hypothetical protein
MGGRGRRGTILFAVGTFLTFLSIRQEKSEILSHPFPQKTREWMGQPELIASMKML